ncbi:hypothetical protein C2E23DRAFT_891335 [Lenzites betulinus]|nr:hypothetical protein C2E23DRAFT_891335 [Lenzites betulinus]
MAPLLRSYTLYIPRTPPSTRTHAAAPQAPLPWATHRPLPCVPKPDLASAPPANSSASTGPAKIKKRGRAKGDESSQRSKNNKNTKGRPEGGAFNGPPPHLLAANPTVPYGL